MLLVHFPLFYIYIYISKHVAFSLDSILLWLCIIVQLLGYCPCSMINMGLYRAKDSVWIVNFYIPRGSTEPGKLEIR